MSAGDGGRRSRRVGRYGGAHWRRAVVATTLGTSGRHVFDVGDGEAGIHLDDDLRAIGLGDMSLVRRPVRVGLDAEPASAPPPTPRTSCAPR